jgi:hypothetical protein
MEMFPAANEDQWSLITSVIDDCDYYIVIVGGRYGTIDPASGISYTEREYDYAIEQHKPVLGFVHAEPEEIPVRNSERVPETVEQLNQFRRKVQQKPVAFWRTPPELGLKVTQSLVALMRKSPAEGWIRARFAGDAQALLKADARIRQLETALESARHQPPSDSSALAQGDDPVLIKMIGSPDFVKMDHNFTVETTWNAIFRSVGPVLLGEANEQSFRSAFKQFVETLPDDQARQAYDNIYVAPEVFDTVKLQLRALGLIKLGEKKRSSTNVLNYWSLTPYGDNHLTTLLAIPKGSVRID